MKTDILREKYLFFFKNKNHKIIPGSALVPEDDPTLLFTGAGMNQFKEEFRGNVGDYTRAATCQKCLRTDDLEKVGKTPAHHTLFEMLGNFSFGDYFKKEAISWAWEFLIEELKIPKEKLWISVYKDDEEAYNVWLKTIGVPAEKIVKLGEEENFWPSDAIKKGPNGPCGPCSEIFYDQGKDSGCKRPGCSPDCGCRRFVEIWNLVFTQFERKEGGKLDPLPNKNIDTGMGLERMASVMQGVPTNFEIDIFKPVIDFICRQTNTDYEKQPEKKTDIHCICDHIRAVTFAVCENVLPSNEERGYVIRKLIRKSSMHARNLIKEQKPFLYKLVPVIAQTMHKPYPELEAREQTISQIILAEERRFGEVLQNAESLIEAKFSDKNTDTGKTAFELYDTFGMPLEVTKELSKKLFNLEIDEEGFNKYMRQQKNLSKAGSQMKGEVFAEGTKALSGIAKTQFTGYETLRTAARITAIIKDEERKETAEEGQRVSIILDKSSFYAERGGQTTDKGAISKKEDGSVFAVDEVQIYNDIIIHKGRILKGTLKKDDMVKTSVDENRRLSVAKHHTSTHLLQSALRKVLGEHVEQAGSLVEEGRLRFDFTHFKALNEEQLREIENTVNQYIEKDFKVETLLLKKDEALKLGALAFFGEKYEDTVRVVKIDGISREFCGGTHLEHTAQAQLFKINKESAVSAGVRRIEAVCGEAALKEDQEQKAVLKEISQMLNTDTASIPGRMEELSGQFKKAEKELARLRDKNIFLKIDELIKRAPASGGTALIIEKFSGLSADPLRSIADNLAKKINSYIAVIAAETEDKISLIVSVSKDNINKGIKAGLLAKEISRLLGGSGGGRDDLAQAGAKNNGKLDDVIKDTFEIIRGYLK